MPTDVQLRWTFYDLIYLLHLKTLDRRRNGGMHLPQSFAGKCHLPRMQGNECVLVCIEFPGTSGDLNRRFTLPLPARDAKEFTEYMSRGKLCARAEDAARRLYEQAVRQRWQALALVIKAKLEAVESGIAVFEDEFMANIVLPGGRLVSEEVRPRIAAAYETGRVTSLLPDYSGGAA